MFCTTVSIIVYLLIVHVMSVNMYTINMNESVTSSVPSGKHACLPSRETKCTRRADTFLLSNIECPVSGNIFIFLRGQSALLEPKIALFGYLKGALSSG